MPTITINSLTIHNCDPTFYYMVTMMNSKDGSVTMSTMVHTRAGDVPLAGFPKTFEVNGVAAFDMIRFTLK